ncbi:hypothetical protein OC861_003750 [Tilletia horrida]|nr:hypothetical protein OC861_003750 [Tilletia horrida]
MRQCLLYSGTSSDAKLIGVEFLIEEADFDSLPIEEKPYWHSHQHEVESGLLCALAVRGAVGAVAGVVASVAPPAVHPSGGMPDVLERPYLQQIYKMYGKIFHFYNDPAKEAIPMGPPRLMMSTTHAHPSLISPTTPLHRLVEERDAELQLNTNQKQAQRTEWLPGFRASLDEEAEKKPDGQDLRAPCGSRIAPGADAWEKTGRAPKLVAEQVKVTFEKVA